MTTEETKQNPLIPAQSEASSFKMIFTLGFAGFISGFLLVGIYLFTLPFIEANKAEALKVAIFQVVPGCASYKTLELKGGKLVEISEKEAGATKNPKIFMGFGKKGELLGFAIPAGEPGFQDVIEGILGFRASDKTIIGFEVLESRETPGLGDKIIKDVRFKENFKGLSIEPEIVPVKTGEKKSPNQVETITGATISSKAIVRLLQKAVTHWKPLIEAYLKNKKGEK